MTNPDVVNQSGQTLMRVMTNPDVVIRIVMYLDPCWKKLTKNKTWTWLSFLWGKTASLYTWGNPERLSNISRSVSNCSSMSQGRFQKVPFQNSMMNQMINQKKMSNKMKHSDSSWENKIKMEKMTWYNDLTRWGVGYCLKFVWSQIVSQLPN